MVGLSEKQQEKRKGLKRKIIFKLQYFRAWKNPLSSHFIDGGKNKHRSGPERGEGKDLPRVTQVVNGRGGVFLAQGSLYLSTVSSRWVAG